MSSEETTAQAAPPSKDQATLCMMAATIMQRLVPHNTDVDEVKLGESVKYAVDVAFQVYAEVERRNNV